MLQINTGKLYRRGVGRTNQLTGVLYANVRLPYERAIVTGAGTIRMQDQGRQTLRSFTIWRSGLSQPSLRLAC